MSTDVINLKIVDFHYRFDSIFSFSEGGRKSSSVRSYINPCIMLSGLKERTFSDVSNFSRKEGGGDVFHGIHLRLGEFHSHALTRRFLSKFFLFVFFFFPFRIGREGQTIHTNKQRRSWPQTN